MTRRDLFDTPARVALALLAVLSVIAALPWNPLGPFDARDYTLVHGVSLHYPAKAAWLEPIYALGHILGGAPDFRLAMIATAVWVTLGALLLAAIAERRRGPGPNRGRLARLIGTPVAALALYMVYIAATGLLHFPGWRLEVDNRDTAVADLQTHTNGSHDGIIGPVDNLDWHRQRGYTVIAVTEHIDPSGGFETQRWSERWPSLPGVLPGVEMNDERNEFLLGIGLQGDDPLLYRDHPTDYAHAFIDDVHNRLKGAAIALSWGMKPEGVEKLVAAGIDGFEIANAAHPEMSEALRTQMLQAAEVHKVLLVASTDWHGWGGAARTWTLIHIPGAANMNHAEITAAVLKALRSREQAAFTPVVAGYLGTPSMLRLVLTPLVETARYAATLSPGQLAAWWAWLVVLLGLRSYLHRRGYRLRWGVLSVASVGFAIALSRRAAELFGMGDTTAADYTHQIGLWAVAAAAVAALATLGGLVGLWRDRYAGLAQ